MDDVTVEDDWWLASAAVEALYTLIPHSLGLQSMAHYLNTHGRQFEDHGQFLVDLLKFMLMHNYNRRLWSQHLADRLA